MDLLAGIGAIAILFGVLILTYFATRWYARRVMGGGALSGKHIIIHDRVPMGGNTFLAIVEVSERFYLIGIGERGVQLISMLEDFSPPSGDSPHSKVPFSKLLTDILAKTGRIGKKGDSWSDS